LPWLVALPLLPLVCLAGYVESFAILGRDQGIFQYIAWAIGQGEVDYRDVRDVNGPLIHLLHFFFLKVVGPSERGFRLLDLAISTVVFGFTAQRVHQGVAYTFGARPTPAMARLGWAALGVALLGGQYLRYLTWDTAQRESFCDWFVLVAAALLLPVDTHPTRARVFAGVLLMVACFGKPTYAVFLPLAAAHVFVANAPGGPTSIATVPQLRPALARLMPLVVGAALGLVGMLGVTAAVGDLGKFAHIYLHDAPIMYAYIWPHSPKELLEFGWVRTPVTWAGGLWLCATLVFLAARRLRSLLFLWGIPLGGLASVFAQKKGFPYHLHPVTAGAALLLLTALAVASAALSSARGRGDAGDEAGARGKLPARRGWGAVVVALGTFIAGREAWLMPLAPALQNRWMIQASLIGDGARREDLDRFALPDFAPFDMRAAAAYVRTQTPPGSRVQLYGMDPYLLFLADRRSASPYIYGYDLNTDAAYYGAVDTAPEARKANVTQEIRSIGAAHAKDLLDRHARAPAAAWVLIDGFPLSSYPHADEDLAKSQPQIYDVLMREYGESANFGPVHIYLRREKP
jgi:hypothetical protein